MHFIELLEKYLSYDKRIYDHHTTKRGFKHTYLLENADKYSNIKELYFVIGYDDEGEHSKKLIIPVEQNLPELSAIYPIMLEYPPAIIKLLDYYYLHKLIVNCNIKNLTLLQDNTCVIIYPIMYVKNYFPEAVKTKFIVCYVNPMTQQRKYSVVVTDIIKSEKIYDYFLKYNNSYSNNEIDLLDLERTFMSLEECIKKTLNGIFE